MTIKELEQRLEIPRATIRFYEKEGLFCPSRSENSYREYTEEDESVLKKIIVLRKVGVPVSEIKELLEEKKSLQSSIEKNMLAIQEQMKELEGALNVCKIIQERKDEMHSFDEGFYWSEIQTQEAAGNKFLDILKDVWTFEKKVILDEFEIADNEGNPMYGWKESIVRALISCLIFGGMWYVMAGKERAWTDFMDGFLWPFVCIIIYSIFGLPLHFLGKKYPKVAKTLKTVGLVICTIIVVVIVILVAWN